MGYRLVDGESNAKDLVGKQPSEGLVAVLIVTVIGVGLCVSAVFSACNLEEILRLRYIERPEQDAIEHAEDNDVGADAEGEREDGGESEAR